MSMLPDYIIEMQIDLEEARDFYGEREFSKMRSNLAHLHDMINKSLSLLNSKITATSEPSDAGGE